MTVPPRPLTRNESAALLLILDARDFPGRDALRAQVEAIRAVSDAICPCDLRLSVADAAPASVADGPLRTYAVAHGPRGDEIGLISAWVKGGYLSGLEFGWFVDMPTEYPPPARLVVRPTPSGDA
jgi:hypothetical protein